jgi:WD40 repeat protein
MKENSIIKIVVGKYENEILIKVKNNIVIFKLKDISKIVKHEFNTIDNSYEYLIDLFEQSKITINNISHKDITLSLTKDDKNEFEFKLMFNKDYKDIFINELNRLKNEINFLKNENKILSKEISKLKNCNSINPENIEKLAEIKNHSYTSMDLDNTFTVFRTINDILYLIYSTESKSIICYDLENQKIINKVKKSHNEYITNFKYYFDNINKRDLLMSISKEDNNIRVWNVNNWECLCNLKNINKTGLLYSACLLNDKQNYIITSNYSIELNSEPIKVFDFRGNKIKEIDGSNEDILYIDSYYDKNLSKSYIITGNINYVKSYDFIQNKLYFKYCDNSNTSHNSIIIKNDEYIVKLIESSYDGNIRIWNFHSGLLLDKIKINEEGLRSICLWHNHFLFVSCEEKIIKLIELKKKIIMKNLEGHTSEVLCLKKLNHSQFGECLISQDYDNNIILWGNKNNLFILDE